MPAKQKAKVIKKSTTKIEKVAEDPIKNVTEKEEIEHPKKKSSTKEDKTADPSPSVKDQSKKSAPEQEKET